MECESEVRHCENLDKNSADEKMENGNNEHHINGNQDKENANPNGGKKASKETQRRHDEPSELSFEICM